MNLHCFDDESVTFKEAMEDERREVAVEETNAIGKCNTWQLTSPSKKLESYSYKVDIQDRACKYLQKVTSIIMDLITVKSLTWVIFFAAHYKRKIYQMKKEVFV